MNCQDIQDLLPLYVSRDLEDNRARLVATHVQSCAACSDVVDEYRETSQLLQDFAPPVFSEAVYSGIRQRVMRVIEEPEVKAAPLAQLFSGLLRPQISWAIATALLIAVGVFAFYFTNRGPVGSQVEMPPQKHSAIALSSPVAQPSGEHKPEVKITGAAAPGFMKRRPGSSGERRSALASNKRPEPQIRSEAARESNKLVEPGAVQSSEKVFRLEMQTKDPNVRIIWLTPPRTKHDSPNKISRGV